MTKIEEKKLRELVKMINCFIKDYKQMDRGWNKNTSCSLIAWEISKSIIIDTFPEIFCDKKEKKEKKEKKDTLDSLYPDGIRNVVFAPYANTNKLWIWFLSNRGYFKKRVNFQEEVNRLNLNTEQTQTLVLSPFFYSRICR